MWEIGKSNWLADKYFFMATILCKRPGCDSFVDTDLACKDVTSLFGIRSLVEAELQKLDSGTDAHDVASEQLNYIKRQINDLQIPEMEKHYSFFRTKRTNPSSPLVPQKISRLYLRCANGHSYNYDVDCSQ